MLTTTRKIWVLFTRRERWQLAGVLVAVLVMGLLQVAGVGSIAPFVGLLARPEAVHDNAALSWAFEALGFGDTRTFLVFAGLVTLGVIALSNVTIALTLWLVAVFTWSVQNRLSARLLEAYVSRPYEAFLNRNSADMGKNVLQEVQFPTGGVLAPALQILAFGLATLFIFGFLLWFNPIVAGLAVGTVGGGYLLVFFGVRRILSREGERRIAANTLRYKSVNEAFGGIKEAKVLGREGGFLSQFRGPARQFARAMAISQVLGQVPFYFIQIVAIASLMGIVLYTIGRGQQLEHVLPLVSVYAFAGYRILPALGNVYRGWGQIRFNRVVVDTVHRDLVEEVEGSRGESPVKTERMPFEQALELRGVTYSYPGAVEPSIREVSLVVPRGAFVALVGPTGGGKTTLADIILGLLQPEEGALIVDGTPVHNGSLRAWQNNLGYVPQDVFLTDDTVAANIAFGIPREERDQEAVERVAGIAKIHDFVVQELPEGYETIVGERGVRLSGGQRQRLGIARALYHDPPILILDEATSNLDQQTESKVHQAIEQAAAAKTVILIAHRLSTTRSCDHLYFVEQGRITAHGTYAELLLTSDRFRAIAETA